MKYIQNYESFEQQNEGIKTGIVKASLIGSLLLGGLNPIKAEKQYMDKVDSISMINKQHNEDTTLNAILQEIQNNLDGDHKKYKQLYIKLTSYIKEKYGFKPEEKHINNLTDEKIEQLKAQVGKGHDQRLLLEIIGWIGAMCLAMCGVPQALITLRDKNSEGNSWGMLLLWGFGEILAFFYVMDQLDLALALNYGVNILVVGIMLWYKMMPGKEWLAQKGMFREG